MKKLSLVSFVGVDEQTDFTELEKVSESFAGSGLVEWSVLYSDSKSVGNYVRYPSYQFCKNFLKKSADANIQGSLHLCGSVIGRYLNKDKDVIDLCQNATRIQLNLNIKEYPDHQDLTERLWSVIKHFDHHVILQQNKTKEKFMQVFLSHFFPVPISILHDGSGGFGREITEIVAPDQKYFTGYAGGIKPNNVVKIVNLIENNNPNNKQYYIDMESGVRVDNVFSVEKCKEVINNLLLSGSNNNTLKQDD